MLRHLRVTNFAILSDVTLELGPGLAVLTGETGAGKSLIVEAANTGANSADERSANQLQIDSAIDSITRIGAWPWKSVPVAYVFHFAG